MEVIDLDGIGEPSKVHGYTFYLLAEERKLQEGVDRYEDGVFLARDGKPR